MNTNKELERNNNTIDDELNRKYDEVTDLKEENQELLEEIERLRDELDTAHAEKEKHSRRKYNTFEVKPRLPYDMKISSFSLCVKLYKLEFQCAVVPIYRNLYLGRCAMRNSNV